MRFSEALILSVIAAGVCATPVNLEARHHTEAQIAAKEAAGKSQNQPRQILHKRDPEAHHTEAQIAAKNAAGHPKKNQARQAPDEFGPWDSTEDEFGSWVDKRGPEAHHTEAQIAAKEKAKGNNQQKREPHHTEAQIAAKQKAHGSSQN
ncbi:MAG: hypothetical protein M1820_003694 [Bogoriella megaspora]|nr:MAG: hypothetical protein M1820_003694 [Bogoriella megaspora]